MSNMMLVAEPWHQWRKMIITNGILCLKSLRFNAGPQRASHTKAPQASKLRRQAQHRFLTQHVAPLTKALGKRDPLRIQSKSQHAEIRIWHVLCLKMGHMFMTQGFD